MMEKSDFLAWEKSTKDTVDFKKVYVDIADDLVAGLLLSQIVYWSLPDKEGKSKLRVFKQGQYWIAKAHKEWYEEIRISKGQAKLALTKLFGKGLVITGKWKFNGAPTTHVRLNWPIFLRCLEVELENAESESKPVKHTNGNADFADIQPVQTRDSLTENTTEIPSKTKKELSADSASSFSAFGDNKPQKIDDEVVDLVIPPGRERAFVGCKKQITLHEKENAVRILDYLVRNPVDYSSFGGSGGLVEELCELLGIDNFLLSNGQLVGLARELLTYSEKANQIKKQESEEEKKELEKIEKLGDMRGWLFGSLYELAKVYVKYSGDWPREEDQLKWMKAFNNMHKKGITPRDVLSAIHRMREKGLIINSPFSVIGQADSLRGIRMKYER